MKTVKAFDKEDIEDIRNFLENHAFQWKGIHFLSKRYLCLIQTFYQRMNTKLLNSNITSGKLPQIV